MASRQSKAIARRKGRESGALAYIEQFYFSKKRFPNVSELVIALDWTVDEINQYLRRPTTIAALERRGIDRDALLSTSTAGVVSPRQVAVAHVMLNHADGRSMEQKLSELGVTPEQYQGWLQDRYFKQYLINLADEVLENVYPEANTVLAQKVRQGNIQAMRLYYDITGRTQSQEMIKAKVLVNKVLEAVQKHVHNPETLRAIAEDIEGGTYQ